jgi:hypothetical protein
MSIFDSLATALGFKKTAVVSEPRLHIKSRIQELVKEAKSFEGDYSDLWVEVYPNHEDINRGWEYDLFVLKGGDQTLGYLDTTTIPSKNWDFCYDERHTIGGLSLSSYKEDARAKDFYYYHVDKPFTSFLNISENNRGKKYAEWLTIFVANYYRERGLKFHMTTLIHEDYKERYVQKCAEYRLAFCKKTNRYYFRVRKTPYIFKTK